jgi:hypothetical protein
MKIKLAVAANTWTHLALAAVIVAEASFIFLGMRFLMPACRRLVLLSGLDSNDAYGFMPGGTLLLGLLGSARAILPWLLIAFVVGWIIFEWSARGGSKRGFRLSVMTSMSLVLFGIAVAFAALMLIPAVKAGERMSARYPEPVVTSQIVSLDRLVGELDSAVAKQDWPATHLISHEGGGAAQNLVLIGDSASALLTLNQQAKIDDIRAHLESVKSFMQEIWAASRRDGEPDRIETAMRGLHTAYGELKADIPQPPK